MLKEHIVKSHPDEEMPEELLGAETYILGDGPEGEMDMDADGEGEAYSHHQFVDESGQVIETGEVS